MKKNFGRLYVTVSTITLTGLFKINTILGILRIIFILFLILLLLLYCTWDRDSTVGIVTRYELKSSEFEPRGCEIFNTRPDSHWGTPNLLYTGHRVLSGRKAAKAWSWPPTPFLRRSRVWLELHFCLPSVHARHVTRHAILYFKNLFYSKCYWTLVCYLIYAVRYLYLHTATCGTTIHSVNW